jgi:calpain
MSIHENDFTYKFEAKRDYFRGITSILNSETAALAKAEEIYNSLKEGEEFLDVDFGPKKDSDTSRNKNSLYFNGTPPAPGYPKPEDVVWLRPTELPIETPPVFLNHEVSSNDVKQGDIGDCWLIGALSVLATRDDLFGGDFAAKHLDLEEISSGEARQLTTGVYPPIFMAYRDKGIYVFRFFKNFKWRYILIDDRIPCYKSTKLPCFGKCRDLHETWVPLIEKAYAKLHGSYESLISGFIDDALTDLSGYVAEKVHMHDKNDVFPNKKAIKDSDSFWDYLKSRRKDKCMMGCSVSGPVEHEIVLDGIRTGILANHAYGILDVIELPNEELEKDRKFHRLLRVRNPWGQVEWKGKWGDTSEELETNAKAIKNYIDSLEEEEKFTPGENDGAFLINYSNWR